MSFRVALLLGLLGGLGHLFIRTYVEQIYFPHFSFDDIMVYVRPAINFYYNGVYDQLIKPNQWDNLPPHIQGILSSLPHDGRCLPHHGALPGNLVFILPILWFADKLSWDSDTLNFWIVQVPAKVAIVGFVALSVLIAYFASREQSPLLRGILIGVMLVLPPYANWFEHFFIFYSLSAIMIILYFRKKSNLYLLLGIITASLAYFMKQRVAPVIFGIPLLVYFIEKKTAWKALAFLLGLWGPFQLLWSWHVYRHTCRWSLIDPSPVYIATPCTGDLDEYCYTWTNAFDQRSAQTILLEGILGIPHRTFFHPDALSRFVKGIRYRDYEPQPFPWFIRKDSSLYRRYLHVIWLSWYADSTEALDKKIQVLYTRFFVSQTKLLMLETHLKYPWLPLYRAWRVFWDNVFHPPVWGFTEKSRGRFPSWIRKSYFYYTRIYVAVSHLLGIAAGLLVGWALVSGRLQEQYMREIAILTTWGWGILIAPLVTGASEWRYFFPSAPMLMLAGLLSLAYLREKLEPVAQRVFPT